MDEAAREPELVAYRAQLIAAAESRDWKALHELIHPQVSYGPYLENAKRYNMAYFWNLPERSSFFWGKFLRALRFGGRFAPGGQFEAPGLHLAWPEAYDPRRWYVAAGPEVALREGPGPDTPVLARLAYDMLEPVPMPGFADVPYAMDYTFHNNHEHHGRHGYAWENFLHVRTAAGQTGYVYQLDAISPLEHQVYFSKVEDRWWQMVAFVAPGSFHLGP